jgi:hypothetical protein
MDNPEIERIGTTIVIEYEKSQGRQPSSKKYPGCGWDLCFANPNTRDTRFIEVKTTTKKKLTGRWLEKAGYQELLNNPNFYIYGVTEVNEDGTGKLKIYTKDDITIKEDIKYVMSFNK